MKKFDITVVGGGPGGYVAAIRAAQLGASVALVEKEYLGGTCLNWGCIPTKSLIATAELLHEMRHADDFGLKAEGGINPDWPAIINRKSRIVENLRKGIDSLLKANQVTVYHGRGEFASRRQIHIFQENKTRPEQQIESDRVILATGSASFKPGFIPDTDNIVYSREALDLSQLPKSIIILGGGVIGSEFACMFARFGVEVTMVEMLPEILPMLDRDVVRVVRKSMKELGIKVMTGKAMEKISSDRQQVQGKVGDPMITAEKMLVCIGRHPYTQGLNLSAAGLATNAEGLIEVDTHCRTRVNGIYAIGDITGTIQYAHRASAQGLVAAENATGGRQTHNDALVPACIFTSPEIGTVGLTATEAEQDGRRTRVGKFPFAALGKAQIHGQTAGFCKIIADQETDQVLGVQIVGPHATDLIAEATTAMNLEITATELGRAMHAHPTLGEISMEAAHAVHQQSVHMPPRRK